MHAGTVQLRRIAKKYKRKIVFVLNYRWGVYVYYQLLDSRTSVVDHHLPIDLLGIIAYIVAVCLPFDSTQTQDAHRHCSTVMHRYKKI